MNSVKWHFSSHSILENHDQKLDRFKISDLASRSIIYLMWTTQNNFFGEETGIEICKAAFEKKIEKIKPAFKAVTNHTHFKVFLFFFYFFFNLKRYLQLYLNLFEFFSSAILFIHFFALFLVEQKRFVEWSSERGFPWFLLNIFKLNY